jgi:hypothetical protein
MLDISKLVREHHDFTRSPNVAGGIVELEDAPTTIRI